MAKMPDPQPSLLARIRKIEEWMRRKDSASPFFGTGMSPNGLGGLDSDNFVTGVSGYRLAETPEFNDLKLRGSIISNDALASPVVPGVAREVASGFTLAVATLQEKAGTDLTVPDGCTRLLATVSGRLYAVNTRTTGGADGTGTDALYVSIKLGSTAATLATPTGISGSNGFATTTTSEAYSLSGLIPGSTLRLGVWCASGYQTLTHADNRASYSATLLWLR